MLTAPWQIALLEACRVGHLGTIGPLGRPHIVPVCYALHEDGVVIAVDEKPKRSSTDLARLRNIRRDPRVTLLVDHYDEDWAQLAWLRVEAMALLEERGGTVPGALAALRARYPQYHPMALEELPLIVLRIERVTGWRAAGVPG